MRQQARQIGELAVAEIFATPLQCNIRLAGAYGDFDADGEGFFFADAGFR
jgi:hypothetical protein